MRTSARISWTVVVLVVGMMLTGGAASAARSVPSTDRLPRENWAYDAMISLASDGLVRGYAARVFEGDRAFDRMEMAAVVASVVRDTAEKTVGPGSAALIARLVEEFRPEITVVDPSVLDTWSSHSPAVPAGTTLLMGDIRAEAVHDTVYGSTVLIPYRLSAFSSLSDHSFAIATLADREDKNLLRLNRDPDPDKVFVKGYSGDFTWEIGRDYYWWGPAYAGSLILSDNSSGFWNAGGTGEVYLGRLLGRVKITQFASGFEDFGEMFYLLGRRYERPLSRRWHIGISEAAKTGQTPNPLIMVLPFYLYQHLFIEVDEEFNALYSADLRYDSGKGYQAYGEFVIDDITQPGIIGGGSERPRKTGFTFGLYFPKVLKGDRPSNLRVEYTSIDRLTYGATRPEFPGMAYTHNGAVIGHPIGQNARALYLRAERYLSDRLSVIGEYLDQCQSQAGPPERGKQKIAIFQVAYDIAPDKSLSFRFTPYESTPPGQARSSATRYQLRASFGF